MCFFQAVSRATKSRAAGRAGGSSSPASTSARELPSYPSTTDASQEAVPTVAPVVASDRVQTTGCSSGWQQCPFDSSDQSGTSLFSELQGSVSHAWAQGTHSTYRGPWNMFVRFCNERNPPLCPMPASAVSVALFLYLRLSGASSYSVVRTTSAAINYMHEINLLPSPSSNASAEAS